MTSLPDNFNSLADSTKPWPLAAKGALVQRVLAELAEELQASSSADPSLAMAVTAANNAFKGWHGAPGAAGGGAEDAAPSGDPVERVVLLAEDAEFVPDTGDLIRFWERLQKDSLVSDRVSVWPCTPASPVKPAMPRDDGGQPGLKELQKAGQVIGMMAMMGTTDYVLAEANPINADAGPDDALPGARVIAQLHGTAVNAEGTTEGGTAKFAIHCTPAARDQIHKLAGEIFGKEYARHTGPKIDMKGLNLDGLFDKNKKASDLNSDLDHA